jgi:acetyl esterase/lipase
MLTETIALEGGALLEPYILKGDAPRPAVLIFPGGGYTFTSDREAEPIALRFNAAGFHAVVLRYRVAPHRHPAPLEDAEAALSLLRAKAGEWRVDPGRIAVCGFSAGGHLAASLGLLGRIRPNAMILCYPVITGGPFAHSGSFENLLGEEASGPLREELSLERRADSSAPPAFIWHTYADEAVPVENSLLLASALRGAGVPFELHIFPEGSHGLSLAEAETDSGRGAEIDPHVARWMPLCLEWLEGLFRSR